MITRAFRFGFYMISLLICCAFVSKEQQAPASILKNGDIIFHTSTSSQSKAIQLATKSKYSHMGIIYEINGELFVYEAVQPVKLTKLQDWIRRGDGEHYVVKRLKNASTLFTKASLKKMREVGDQFKGKKYDLYFAWSDERIYCSELVWKIYDQALGVQIGDLQQLKEFDLTHPTVKQKMKERYGDNIPMNEKVISPSAMFTSELLTTVVEK